jgi:hypothetical protein
MHSEKTAPGGAAQRDFNLSQRIEALIFEHGTDADIVAAQRADSFFLSGDDDAGGMWSMIFRQIVAQISRRSVS